MSDNGEALDWRGLYAATMAEKDGETFEELIAKTSRAIEARLDQLMKTKEYEDERKQIVIAANALLMLKAARRARIQQKPS